MINGRYVKSSVLRPQSDRDTDHWHASQRPRTLNLDTYLGIEEKLFLHWQEVKRPKWFKMPEDGVGDDGKYPCRLRETSYMIEKLIPEMIPPDILEVNVNYVVTFNRKTLETTFVAERDGTTFRMMPGKYLPPWSDEILDSCICFTQNRLVMDTITLMAVESCVYRLLCSQI